MQSLYVKLTKKDRQRIERKGVKLVKKTINKKTGKVSVPGAQPLERPIGDVT